jgi:Flp pilus assembly protein TadG
MRRDERASASMEMVLLTPVLLCLLLFVVAGGRLVTARSDVSYAAKVGARAASLARSPSVAEADGRAAVLSTLDGQNVNCKDLDIVVDSAELRPGGQVTTTLECDVDLSMASLLGLPLTKSVHTSFTEPVDVFIGRA